MRLRSVLRRPCAPAGCGAVMASLRTSATVPLLALCCMLHVAAAGGESLPAWTSSSSSGVHRSSFHCTMTRASAASTRHSCQTPAVIGNPSHTWCPSLPFRRAHQLVVQWVSSKAHRLHAVAQHQCVTWQHPEVVMRIGQSRSGFRIATITTLGIRSAVSGCLQPPVARIVGGRNLLRRRRLCPAGVSSR